MCREMVTAAQPCSSGVGLQEKLSNLLWLSEECRRAGPKRSDGQSPALSQVIFATERKCNITIRTFYRLTECPGHQPKALVLKKINPQESS